MSAAEECVLLIVRAVNAWLAATGHKTRISARDIVVTQRDRRFILAFEVEE